MRLPSHVLISHKVVAACKLYVKQHVLDARYRAFTGVQKQRRIPIVVATSCQKKQLRHTSMLVSTRQVKLRTILRLSAHSLRKLLLITLQPHRYGDIVCCAMMHSAFKSFLTCAMLHARLFEVPRHAEKGNVSMILIAPISWMRFMDQTSLKILSIAMPLDCCQETGNNK